MRRRVLRRHIWVYTVCSGLSVRIHTVNTETIICNESADKLKDLYFTSVSQLSYYVVNADLMSLIKINKAFLYVY